MADLAPPPPAGWAEPEPGAGPEADGALPGPSNEPTPMNSMTLTEAPLPPPPPTFDDSTDSFPSSVVVHESADTGIAGLLTLQNLLSLEPPMEFSNDTAGEEATSTNSQQGQDMLDDTLKALDLVVEENEACPPQDYITSPSPGQAGMTFSFQDPAQPPSFKSNSSPLSSGSSSMFLSQASLMKEDGTRCLVRALCDFHALRSEELTVYKDDIFELLSERKHANDGWFTGVCCDSVGLVPSHLVQPIEAELESRIARALIDFKAQHDDALTFRLGELIEIVSQGDHLTWTGRIRGQFGVFNHTMTEIFSVKATDRSRLDSMSSVASRDAQQQHRWEIDFAEVDLGKSIGRGGFSTVSRALFRGRVVAVKQLYFNQADDDEKEVARKLRQEADLFSQLSHRNIVQFEGACSRAPNFCIVMEYCENGTLSRHLTKTLEPSKLLDWARQIAKGMNYLHEEAPMPIIHRDLKSCNILVAAGDVLKITDFGLARTHTNTTQMSAAGTFAWMSPEVIRSSMYSKGADVWAYGVVLWEMLTGQVPYRDVEAMAVAYGVATNNLTLTIPERLPPPFAEIMSKCWAREPHGRPSFSQIAYLLATSNANSFLKTPRASFISLQHHWNIEIERKNGELRDQEQELLGREEELRRRAAHFEAKEAELKRREQLLQQRERDMQLRARSVALEAPAESPAPSVTILEQSDPRQRRASRRTLSGLFRRKQLKSTDVEISAPTNFTHVSHLGHGDVTRKLSKTDDKGAAFTKTHQKNTSIGSKLASPFRRVHSRSRSDATGTAKDSESDKSRRWVLGTRRRGATVAANATLRPPQFKLGVAPAAGSNARLPAPQSAPDPVRSQGPFLRVDTDPESGTGSTAGPAGLGRARVPPPPAAASRGRPGRRHQRNRVALTRSAAVFDPSETADDTDVEAGDEPAAQPAPAPEERAGQSAAAGFGNEGESPSSARTRGCLLRDRSFSC